NSTPLVAVGELTRGRHLCGWTSDGKPCNTPVLEKELGAHLHTVHRVLLARKLTCLWGDCSQELDRTSLIRHVREKHL
ncbi:hypothetical protein J3R83DRAFT_3136, partial [Lanmaoa asiatica]